MIQRAIIPQLRFLADQHRVINLFGGTGVGKTTAGFQLFEGRDPAYFDFGSLRERHGFAGVTPDPDRALILDNAGDASAKDWGTWGQVFLISDQPVQGIPGLELTPLTLDEVGEDALQILWRRGGLPGSFTAATDPLADRYRAGILQDYLHRQGAAKGPRIPSDRLYECLCAIAEGQGDPLNVSALARQAGVDHKTIRQDLDRLVHAGLVRLLRPLDGSAGTRTVKTLKYYIADSGMFHTLGGTVGQGASWSGFALQSIAQTLSAGISLQFYKTGAGAEIPLVLTVEKTQYAITFATLPAPKISRGFRSACDAMGIDRRLVLHPDPAVAMLPNGLQVWSLPDLLQDLSVRIVG